ncbi:MAG TPA: FAD-binding protein, partial [Nitrospinota bacterium]|nr:FAD-binding protein [Nitrospinota bacterium]
RSFKMRINGTAVRVVETDVLIIGTEATGGKAALEAADLFPDCRIVAVSKQVIARSAVTITAVATYNAAVNPYDDPAVHTVDTIKGGAYLAVQKLTRRMCEIGPQCVHEMEAWGCRFARQEKDPRLYDCYEYPGHSRARGAYTFPFGTTGRKMVQILKREIFKRDNVKVMNDVFITDILISDGRCVGALGVRLVETQPIVFRAKAVIIGAGGGMEIFRNSDAARDATGNGYGWAYRAGGTLIDMELVQFFPVNLLTPKTLYANQPAPSVLRYGLGGRFYNNKGERFMHRYDPERGERVTRDVVSRAMWMEILEGRGTPNGGVYLSIAHLPDNVIDNFIAKNNPGYNFGGVKLNEEGLDIKHGALEVAPMAHFYLGGIRINERCETSIAGLYAAGEAAGNVHGANRLGGNALTDCQVFGKIAGGEAAKHASTCDGLGPVNEDQVRGLVETIDAIYRREQGTPPHVTRNKIRDAMYNVSVVKREDWIKRAMETLKAVRENDLPVPRLSGKAKSFSKELMLALENEDLLLTAELHLKGALMRTETRGAQCRLDHPDTDNENWCKNILYRKDGDDVKMWTQDVDFCVHKPDFVVEKEKQAPKTG